MKKVTTGVRAGLFLFVGLLANTAMASTGSEWCDNNKIVRFAEVGWDSGKFETEIIRQLMERGYGCKTETVPGTNPITMGALIGGKIQFFVEYWQGRTDTMEQAAKEDKIKFVGSLVKGGGIEGIYVPEYVIKGDPSKGIAPMAPDLKSVADLSKYKALFKDPEDPKMGRFLNCPSGWSCEKDNNQRIKAYDLTGTYNNFRPGTGAALDAAIAGAFQRKQPLLFSYFEPSSILGKYKSIRLEEPSWNEDCWKTINGSTQDKPCGSASPATNLTTAVATDFAQANPGLIEFIGKVELPITTVNEAIAEMADKKIPADKMAEQFLRDNPTLWKAWVSEPVGSRIQASLD
jgi:glycine betaine/proline transport system substrate-binding protein